MEARMKNTGEDYKFTPFSASAVSVIVVLLILFMIFMGMKESQVITINTDSELCLYNSEYSVVSNGKLFRVVLPDGSFLQENVINPARTEGDYSTLFIDVDRNFKTLKTAVEAANRYINRSGTVEFKDYKKVCCD